ncbi:MAG: hypothetical protein LC792_03585 [Actinobacteria bacterium]|nr:hypothetical protein [Actinomycetota bacterium]
MSVITDSAEEIPQTGPTSDELANLAWLLTQAYLPINALYAKAIAEHFGGEPTIDSWMTSMWGIRPGSSSPVSQLSTGHVPPEARPWMRLWAKP